MVLKDVFYALDIAVTLISVGRIDAAGYSTTFGGGACVIHNKAKMVIRKIPIQSSLYHIEHDKSVAGSTLITKEVLAIMELHH